MGWDSVGNTVLGAGLSALSGFVSGQQNLQNSKEMASHNNQIWQQQFGMQNDRQDYLLRNQYQMQQDSMRQAGLSALWNGNQPTLAGVTTPSGGNGSVSNSAVPFVDPLSVAQADLIHSQADLANTQAEGQKIQNQNNTLDLQQKENFLKEYQQYSYQVSVSQEMADQFNQEGGLNPMTNKPWKVGDVMCTQVACSFGQYKAMLEKSQGADIMAQNNYNIAHYQWMREGWTVEEFEREARSQEAQLKAKIKRYQNECPEIVDALIDMPSAEWSNLIASAAKYFASATADEAKAYYDTIAAQLAPAYAVSDRLKAEGSYLSGYASMWNANTNEALAKPQIDKQTLENEAYGAVNSTVRGYTDFVLGALGEVAGIVQTFYRPTSRVKTTVNSSK